MAKRKAQKSPPVQRRGNVSVCDEEEGGMFSAVLAGRSALQVYAHSGVCRHYCRYM